MARYTKKDADGRYYIESANGKLESNIKGHTYGESIDRFAELENADVAPKSEVAREIVKEIRHEIELALESNYKARKQRLEGQVAYDAFVSWVDGKIAALKGIDDFINSHIAKKYTEGDK